MGRRRAVRWVSLARDAFVDGPVGAMTMAHDSSWGDDGGGRQTAMASRERAEDAVLAQLARGDRRGAFELLMKTEGDIIYAFCLHIVGDPFVAEDVQQKVLLQAYEGLARFSGGSSLRTWLLSIAKFRSLDALRILRREASRFASEDSPLVELVDGAPGAAERIDDARTKSALERGLEICVSDAERLLLSLHFRDGLSYEEMGALLGQKPDTLRARVVRALPKLRRFLERQGVGGRLRPVGRRSK